jgi:hypothetical protein
VWIAAGGVAAVAIIIYILSSIEVDE